jgi:hypothetical protein
MAYETVGSFSLDTTLNPVEFYYSDTSSLRYYEINPNTLLFRYNTVSQPFDLKDARNKLDESDFQKIQKF